MSGITGKHWTRHWYKTIVNIKPGKFDKSTKYEALL